MLVSPQPTMRVLENPTALPFGTMTAPPAGAVPCGAPCASVASVQRLETNREVWRGRTQDGALKAAAPLPLLPIYTI